MAEVPIQRLKKFVLLIDQYTADVCIESYNYFSAILIRNLLIKRINFQKDPSQSNKVIIKSYHTMSHLLVEHGIYPTTQRWIWNTISKLVRRSAISIGTVTKIVNIVINDLLSNSIHPFPLGKIAEISCDDYVSKTKNDDKVHSSVAIYNNNEHVVNIVRGQDLEDYIEYNIKYRPGRALFVDGVCKHSGYLSDKRIQGWTNKIMEMKFDLSTPSSRYR